MKEVFLDGIPKMLHLINSYRNRLATESASLSLASTSQCPIKDFPGYSIRASNAVIQITSAPINGRLAQLIILPN